MMKRWLIALLTLASLLLFGWFAWPTQWETFAAKDVDHKLMKDTRYEERRNRFTGKWEQRIDGDWFPLVVPVI